MWTNKFFYNVDVYILILIKSELLNNIIKLIAFCQKSNIYKFRYVNYLILTFETIYNI